MDACYTYGRERHHCEVLIVLFEPIIHKIHATHFVNAIFSNSYACISFGDKM